MMSGVGPAKNRIMVAHISFDRGAVASGGEVSGGGEADPVAGGHGGVAEPGCDVGLPDAGRADQEHVRRGVEITAGGEFGEQRLVDAGGIVVVEVIEGLSGREVRESESAGEGGGRRSR